MQRKRSRAKAPAKPRAAVKKAPRRQPVSAATDGRRAELVLATYELIAEKGLEELRTRDIAAKVGINISTLHYYFDTKEALVAAVVDHMTQLFRSLREPLADGASPLQELRHLFATQRYRRRVEPRLDVVVQEMMLRGRRDERVRARLEVMLLTWNGYVESLIERGVRAGDFARNVDPKLAAAIITSYLIGTNLQQGVRPTSFAFEATSDALVSWLLPK
jgi:AcrR family transcriptional regulator